MNSSEVESSQGGAVFVWNIKFEMSKTVSGTSVGAGNILGKGRSQMSARLVQAPMRVGRGVSSSPSLDGSALVTSVTSRPKRMPKSSTSTLTRQH